MTSIFRRRGRIGYTLAYIDATGRRRMRSFRTRALAEEKALDFRVAPDPGRTVLFRDFAKTWLARCSAHLRPGSYQVYSSLMKGHLAEAFGHLPLVEISRGAVKDFLVRKRASFSAKYVSNMRRVLHGCLEEAREDGLLHVNPAARGRAMRLGAAPRPKTRAFDLAQLSRFLDLSLEREPACWTLFRVLALTGMRLGEALGLRWQDIDWAGRRVMVVRGFTRRTIQRTKTGREREVDLAADLVADLRRLEARRKEDALRAGNALQAWLWPSARNDRPMDHELPEQAFARALKAMRTDGHFTPHSLRHTYASLLLSRGVSVYYVQRQLGHASISITADLYGRWLPAGDHAVVDGLAAAIVTVPVTEEAHTAPLGDTESTKRRR